MSHRCCRNRQRCVLWSSCPGFITWPCKITLETFVAFLYVFKRARSCHPPPLYNSVSPCLLPFFCQNCRSSLSRLNFLTVSELTFSLEPNHQWYSCAHSHFKRHIGLKKKERNFVCVVVEVMLFIHKPPFVFLSVCQMLYAFVFCLFMYILCLLSSHGGVS